MLRLCQLGLCVLASKQCTEYHELSHHNEECLKAMELAIGDFEFALATHDIRALKAQQGLLRSKLEAVRTHTYLYLCT
jgi:hypothetical protein